MFTSSFQEDAESIVLTPPENKPHEGLSNMVRLHYYNIQNIN